MRRFGLLILRLTVFLVLFVLAVNVLFHRPWLESLLFALALAVGLTPELLPAIVTVTLSRGARRMAARRVIVKRLPAIHDLGAMDVLCTDKTGTLTEARIRLVRHLDPQGGESERVFTLAYLNSAFESGLKSPLDEAMLEHAQARRSRAGASSTRCRSTSSGGGSRCWSRARAERLLVVKGAPEDVLRLSTSYEAGARRGAPAGRGGARRPRWRASSSWARRASGRSASPAGRVGPDHASAAVGDEAS